MNTALRTIAVSTLVGLLAVACNRSGLEIKDSGPGGGGGNSTGVAGAGGSGNGQSGGMSGSAGGVPSGGVTGSGGSTPCPPPSLCIAAACTDGYQRTQSNDCECLSDPCGCSCGCWTCTPVSTSGSGGTIAAGGASGSSGLGGILSDGGASGSSGVAGSTKVPLNHRSASASCPSQRGPGPSCATTICASQPYPSGVATPSCASDSQCTGGKNGRCFPFEGLVGPGGCSYDECFSDSDCGARTPCLCRSSATDNSANACDVGGNCAVDSDCGPGGYCSPSMGSCPSAAPEVEVQDNYAGPSPYYCHTASDQCVNDSDCASPDAGTASSLGTSTLCAYNTQDKRWECTQITCLPP